jgi:hypothetical protein
MDFTVNFKFMKGLSPNLVQLTIKKASFKHLRFPKKMSKKWKEILQYHSDKKD